MSVYFLGRSTTLPAPCGTIGSDTSSEAKNAHKRISQGITSVFQVSELRFLTVEVKSIFFCLPHGASFLNSRFFPLKNRPYDVISRMVLEPCQGCHLNSFSFWILQFVFNFQNNDS